MSKTSDVVALNDWYAVASCADVMASPTGARLLGQDIVLARRPDGVVAVNELAADAPGRALPVQEKYGCVWTTLGTPAKGVVDIPESRESDRRFVLCGWVTMRASGLRVVENFLDMAHFPFVHTDILGSEPHTDVPNYRSEIRRDVDEVWATNCTFFQPRIAATETEGAFVHLTYRVPSPFAVMLYRVCPTSPDRLDAIALFIQPMEEGLCRAQPVMYLVDPVTPHEELLRFEQVIFAQDLLIVQNQRPLLMPLEAGGEIPTRADSSSVAYRRWLKEKGLRFGTTSREAA
jgi:phenylpropionate dioxygenase-like ring-hydroxylating dioxygenase large terminal subunit